VEGGAALLAYSGDAGLLQSIALPFSRFLAGPNGTAPAGFAWANAAFASSEPGQLTYRGANCSNFKPCGALCCAPGNPCPGDGVNTLEPDKAANVGLGYARLFMLYGDGALLAAALATADALLANENRSADGASSPWPFRARADTGATVEPYTSSVTDALRLFDALGAIARVGGSALVPRAAAYAAARQRVLAWLLAFPATTFAWQGIWEDVPVSSSPTADPSCHTALDAAAYLLDLALAEAPVGGGVDEVAFARRVVDWVVEVFVFQYASAREPAVQWGAYAVSEQGSDRNKMAFHTLHWTSVAARLANATGNSTLGALVEKSFNWCTYVLQDDNQTLIGPVDQSNWISTGLRLPKYAFETIAASSAWGAPGEDHLLRSTGFVTAIAFTPSAIRYTTFEPRSTEWLQLGACTAPSAVTASGVTLPRVEQGSSGGAPEGWWSLDAHGGMTVFKAGATQVSVTC
jgi:hypothetical protein